MLIKRISSFNSGLFKSIFLIVPKGLQGLIGVLTTLILAKHVSPEQQGIYYTLASLQSLFALFDLGATFTFIQYARHEFIAGQVGNCNHISISHDQVNRFEAIVSAASQWLRNSSILHAITLGIFGTIFILTKDDSFSMSVLLWWGASVISVSLSIRMQIVQIYMYSSGKMEILNLLDFSGSLAAFVLSVLFIYNDLALGVLFLQPLMNSLFRVCYYKYFAPSAPSLSSYNLDSSTDWLVKIRRVRRGTALTWICGFLAFNITTPILFHFVGSVQAGRFGITTSVFNGIYMLVISVFQIRNPLWVELISEKDTLSLKKSLYRELLNTTILTSLMFITYFIAVYLLNSRTVLSSSRFLDTHAAILLAFHYLVQVWISGLYVYIRSYRIDETLISGVTTSILFLFAAPLTIVSLGHKYIALVLLLISFLIQLPWTIYFAHRAYKSDLEFL